MQIKRDSNIRLIDGRFATLSTARLPGGEYETMLFTNGSEMEEIAVHHHATEDETVYWFDEIRRIYHVPELTGRYKKLADDLREAVAYGLEHMGDDDGGTCNFDAPTLYLPRWKKELVEAAAKTAGTGCFVWKSWSKSRYVFSVPGAGQGLTRTRAAEAMKGFLEAKGYDAGMYYQVD